jgi:nucleotide-binding universal stress UspA family protein
MGSGPVVIGFDGSPSAERALREGGKLLTPRAALVLVVWEAGLALHALEIPTASVGLPPVPVDLRAGLELEQAMYERAQRLAQHGVELAREVGLEAEGLAVADEVTVADTVVRVAQERD